MYGAILGDLIGFPFEHRQGDLTDREIPLLNVPDGLTTIDAGQAGELFSEKTVLTAALQEGLLRFEKRIPEIFSGRQNRMEKDGTSSKSGSDGASANKGADTSFKEDSPGLSSEGGSAGSSGNEESGSAGSSGNEGSGSPGVPADGARASGEAGKEKSISANVFEGTAASEFEASMRRFGGLFPLAGYAMDLSIWLFREGTKPAENEDPGPAARVSPVPWIFQDDLYMMRRMAVLQAGVTNRNRETLKAADAAACMVFLALHGCTKDYISGYIAREFGYNVPDYEEMKNEILYADLSGGASGMDSGSRSAGSSSGNAGVQGKAVSSSAGMSVPALCVRAALTAFLRGRDFEEVLRLAVSLCGSRIDTAAVTSIAGAAAEAFFGVPDSLKELCRKMIPEEICLAADSFAARVEDKKRARELSPALQSRWESALTRSSENHPASIQGNEPLEQAIETMLSTRQKDSLVAVLEALRQRIEANGRVYVPVTAVRRPEPGEGVSGGKSGSAEGGTGAPGAGNGGPKNMARGNEGRVAYRFQAVRSRDGRLWQPAFTSREQLEKAGGGKGMALSYSIEALFKRFIAVGEKSAGAGGSGGKSAAAGGFAGNSAAADVAPGGYSGGNGNPPSGSAAEGGTQGTGMAGKTAAGQGAMTIPAEISGIVLNPGGKVLFLPRNLIKALFSGS